MYFRSDSPENDAQNHLLREHVPENECTCCGERFDDGFRIALTELVYCTPCVKRSAHIGHFRDNHGEGLTGQEIINITNDLIKI